MGFALASELHAGFELSEFAFKAVRGDRAT